MRTLLLASAAALALGGAAFAQNAPANPRSGQASNITATDTRSAIAPALPSPGAVGTPEQYLNRAQQALRAGRTGEAQEALERAETRLLDRSVAGPNAANQPDNGPRVDAIRRALMALANRDRAGAMSAIQMAMNTSNQGMGRQGMGNPGMGGPGMGTQGMGSQGMGRAMPAAGMNSSATPTNSTMPTGSTGPMGGIGQGAPPTGANAADNTRIYGSCPTPPCVQGTPPAAPGGGGGSGPAALRTQPMGSPVGTGAGENGTRSGSAGSQ